MRLQHTVALSRDAYYTNDSKHEQSHFQNHKHEVLIQMEYIFCVCALHYTPDELGVHCEGCILGGSITGGGGRAPELLIGGGLYE